ncbi:MAG: hypothetical protein IGBAC_0113 [Ignavibacteriae bacterium]|nr:MAG: hypothetical protein IGBAC_0113 [Ignavibacteriota bacterium]
MFINNLKTQDKNYVNDKLFNEFYNKKNFINPEFGCMDVFVELIQ